ncbi:MAG: GTP cyclohydrolase I FolE [Lactobacillales bacterium]|jgi:GTP cyclohydrolase I|nr:GTP cyclohydrolase I FolE [Lactobacillales bacterium]
MGVNEKIAILVSDFLKEIGEDLERDGLKETPLRVSKMIEELFSGLREPKFSDFKTFESETTGELVWVTQIPFYSVCEHHLLPFFGDVSIGYIPAENRTLGLSKFLRLVEYWSKRPSIQEGLTTTICKELTENIPNNGVGVVIKARHLCMEMRGVRSANAITKTESFSGILKTDFERRKEFFERM